MRLAIGLMAIGMLGFGLIALGTGAVSAQQTGSAGAFIQATPIADTVVASEAPMPSALVRWHGRRGFHWGWYGYPGSYWRGGGYYPYSYYYGYWPKRYYRSYQTCWPDGWNSYCSH